MFLSGCGSEEAAINCTENQVQALQNKIRILEKENDDMKAKVATLEKEKIDLENKVKEYSVNIKKLF